MGGGAGVVLILDVRGVYLAGRRWWCSSVKGMDRREGLPKDNSISPQPLLNTTDDLIQLCIEQTFPGLVVHREIGPCPLFPRLLGQD